VLKRVLFSMAFAVAVVALGSLGFYLTRAFLPIPVPDAEATHTRREQSVGGEALPAGPVETERKVFSLPPVVSAQPVGSNTAKLDAPREPSVRRDDTSRPTEEERRAYAASVFDSEVFDAQWAPGARQKIEATISSITVSGVRTRTVECRSSLCRFELESQDVDSEGAFVRAGMRAGIGAGTLIRGELEPSGRISSVIYISRGGSPPPEPEVDHQ
jgi:hypothetical protein